MKKPIILISENSEVLQLVINSFLQMEEHIVKGTLNDMNSGVFKININKNIEQPTCICLHPLTPKELTPQAFHLLCSFTQHIHLPNHSRCTVNQPQIVIGTFTKPNLSNTQESNAIFINIPSFKIEIFYPKYVELLRNYAHLNALPYLKIDTKSATLLKRDYTHRIEFINKIILNLLPNNIEVHNPVTVKA